MLCSLSARCQQQMTRAEIPIRASLRGDGYERRTSERGSPRFRWKNERFFARGVALPAAVPRCNMRAPVSELQSIEPACARIRPARRAESRDLEHLREGRCRIEALRVAVLRRFGARVRVGRDGGTVRRAPALRA